MSTKQWAQPAEHRYFQEFRILCRRYCIQPNCSLCVMRAVQDVVHSYTHLHTARAAAVISYWAAMLIDNVMGTFFFKWSVLVRLVSSRDRSFGSNRSCPRKRTVRPFIGSLLTGYLYKKFVASLLDRLRVGMPNGRNASRLDWQPRHIAKWCLAVWLGSAFIIIITEIFRVA